MDHGEALATKASERYLLGEMDEPERFDFERHYFTCEVCAEDVRNGVTLARGIKAVCGAEEAPPSKQAVKTRHDWLAWLSPAALAPSAVAAALAVVAVYQGLVLIPTMRGTVVTQAMEPVVLRDVARGEEPVIKIDRKTGVSVLAMDVNAGQPGQEIAYELRPPAGGAGANGKTRVPPAGTQLLLVAPNSTLSQAGVWTLVLRTPQGTEAGRYPFRIETR